MGKSVSTDYDEKSVEKFVNNIFGKSVFTDFGEKSVEKSEKNNLENLYLQI